jgi:hypothetical protein
VANRLSKTLDNAQHHSSIRKEFRKRVENSETGTRRNDCFEALQAFAATIRGDN